MLKDKKLDRKRSALAYEIAQEFRKKAFLSHTDTELESIDNTVDHHKRHAELLTLQILHKYQLLYSLLVASYTSIVGTKPTGEHAITILGAAWKIAASQGFISYVGTLQTCVA